MTLREKIIIETYTGVCMVTGEDRQQLHTYMAALLGRPVLTHELADPKIIKELKNRSKADFVSLCCKPETNKDKIRQMEDKDLAFMLMCPYDIEGELCIDSTSGPKQCLKCIVEWLNKPAN